MSMESDVSEETATPASSEESSGRWIRDQLRDVADAGLENLEAAVSAPPEQAAPVEDSASKPTAPEGVNDIVAGLAASISSAVAVPIQTLERRRSEERAAVDRALRGEQEARQASERRVDELAEQVQRLEQSLADARRNSDEAGDRIAQLEQQNLPGAVQQVQGNLGELTGRIEGAERAMRAQAEIVRSLEESERRRRESAGHLSELLERMRETVSTMNAAPSNPNGHSEEQSHGE